MVNSADAFTSLREALDDTIVLGATQSYSLTNCAAGALTHTAADDLEITGNGSTITQTCNDAGILERDNTTATFTVDGVTLVGGPNTGVSVNGAGILSQSQLVLSDSTVTGVDGGPGGNVIDGGMGLVPSPEILLSNAVVTNNDNTATNIDFGGDC